MTPIVQNVIRLLSGATVVADIAIVLFGFALFLASFRRSVFVKFFSDNVLLLGFISALIASLGSYFFSDYIGFPPCEFCWYARIFMFPQVFLFGIALWKKDRSVVDYVLVLSIIGVLINAFHYYGQMFNTSALPCKPGGVSCAVIQFIEFGYVTIPMMSLTAFLMLALISLSAKIYRR